MSPDDERHGTRAGYLAHGYYKTPPCDACKQAAREYQKQWRKTEGAEREPARNRARSRALWRLADAHRDEFERLYLAELAAESHLTARAASP